MRDRNQTPVYRDIAEQYRSRILSGDLPPRALIPSQVELAKIHRTSVVTIQKALSLLVKDGLIQRVRRKGSFVSNVEDRRPVATSGHLMSRVYFVHNEAPIDFFSHDIIQSMFRGMAKVCEKNRVAFHFFNLHDTYDLPSDASSGIILWGFRGWREFGNSGPELLRAVNQWNQDGRHLLTLHHYFPHLNIPHINADNMAGGYLATQHLLSLGHRRIGIILSGASMIDLKPEFAFRLQGYRLALDNYGIAFDPAIVSVQDNDREDEASGYKGFCSVMSNPQPPTAVFASTDFKALGAMSAAQDFGLRVPDDMSIVGYDGYAFGEYTVPPLTTVDQNFNYLGQLAVEVLLRSRTNERTESLVVPKLIIRGSTQELSPRGPA